jgi:hypothetical protein
MNAIPSLLTVKRFLSRCSSLLLMFQKSPVVQMIFPQANFLSSAAAMNSTGIAITAVVGLGAYDSVAGATVVVQQFPDPGSNIVEITAGTSYSGASAPRFQATGNVVAVMSWSITNGSLPSGLTLNNISGNPTTVTGTATQTGDFNVRITAWQNSDFSGNAANGNFTIRVSAGTPAGITTHPVSTTINSGNTANLTVSANGSPPFTYKWYQGASGDTSTPVGTSSSAFTTPVLTATTSYWVNVSNFANPTGANSNTATVTVRQPAAIATHPQSTLINSGESTMLSVTATGDPPLTYQWYQGASGVTTTAVGTNSPNFTTPALTTTTSYWVKVTNIANTAGANSNAATVTIRQPAVITTQPESVAIFTGETTMLSVEAGGTEPLTYQWYQGLTGDTSTPVGTNSASFTTPALSSTTNYWVKVSNAANPEGTDSVTATVTVLKVTPPYAHALILESDLVAPSSRGEANSTWSGWASFNEPGERAQPINDATPDIGYTLEGATFRTTNGEDHVLDTGEFSFDTGTLAEEVTIPSDGVVGMDGFTTVILQIAATPASGPFPGVIYVGTIDGVTPEVVQGVNSLGDGQLWAKWKLPGNKASYVVELVGAPNQAGFKFNLVMVETFFSQTAYLPDSMALDAPATTTATPLPFAVVGMAYEEQLAGTGGTAPYEFGVSAGTLPLGLTLSPSGLLSGTPTTGGTKTFTVTIFDANILTSTKEFELEVATLPEISSPGTLPVGMAGSAYNQALQVTGGTAPFTWTLTEGNLPQGIMLSSAGLLSGTPDAASESTFTVEVEDGHGFTDTQEFNLTISTLAIATGSPLPTGVIKVAYNQALSATGGVPPYTWEVAAGMPPAGITLSAAGVLSGTPTLPGESTFTVRVTDSTSFAVTKQLTLPVSGKFIAPVIETVNFPVVTIGTEFNYTLKALNYPKTFTATGLPSGLKLTGATGVIAGRPAVAGIFNVQIRATNTGGKSTLVTARLTVKALDRGFVGSFGGWFERDAPTNRGLGGMINLTVTANGSYTFKVTGGLDKSGSKGASATYSGKGFLAASAPQISVAIGGQQLTLSLDSVTGAMSGLLGPDAVVTGWRNVWNTLINPAEHLQGYYSFAIDLTDPADQMNADIPQGTGYATFAINAVGGLTLTGKMADGESITGTSFVGPGGQLWIFTPLYKGLGTLLGQLALTEDPEGLFAGNSVGNAPGKTLTWSKPETKTKSYLAAFGPANLAAEGAYLAPASKGNVVLGLPDAGAVTLSFDGGGLTTYTTNPDMTFTYTDENKVLPPAAVDNPGKVAVTINAATGAVSGNFTLEETNPPLKRANVPFLGQVVRLADGGIKAVGWFMLPQIPVNGQTAANAPSLSGAFGLIQDAE